MSVYAYSKRVSFVAKRVTEGKASLFFNFDFVTKLWNFSFSTKIS